MARRWRIGGVVAVGVVVALVLLLAMFPFGMLRGTVERRLSDAIGRPATIGSLERDQAFSFRPRLIFRDVAVPQPAWVGERIAGPLAQVREGSVQIAVLPLLLGRLDVRGVEVRGGAFNLYRSAEGRENWSGGDTAGSGSGPTLETLTATDVALAYVDDKQRRAVRGRLTADARGLRLEGRGSVAGHAVTVTATGGPVLSRDAWPFRVAIEGDAVGLTAAGTMARALDTRRLSARVTGHATDLKLLDRLIEAGLFGTQDVRLDADVRREGATWHVDRIAGTIGRSRLRGKATVTKADARTRIDGEVRLATLAFDDLASDEGLARARALEARIGARVLPATRIDLKSLDDTDGRLAIRVDRMLAAAPFRTLDATLVLERSRLSIDDLRAGMARGQVTGSVVVDQRNGGPPVLTTRLALTGARLDDFFPNAGIAGALRGRIALTGRGETVRGAIGRSTGSIALVASGGTIPARTASLLGQDVARGLTTDVDALATLRCVVARFDVRGGVARPDPVVIDTSRATARITGTMRLSDDRLALSLSGAPKQRSLLRLDGDVQVRGTIGAPDVRVPPEARSARGVLRMLGRAISGRQGPLASDVDCAGLARRALG